MSNIVLITGANRGIGLALVKEYLSRGDQVIAVCRRSSSELNALSVKVVENIDVASEHSLQALKLAIDGVTIDILINNAGILKGMSFQSLNYADMMAQFEVNAVGPIRVVEALVDCLKEGSKIGLITSRMGSIKDNSSGGSYGYRMSKCALNAAGKSLAIDLKPKGILVALLHPGYVSTEMVNWGGEISPEISAERLVQRIEQLNQQNSGSFWHSNGELLPW